MATVIDSLLVTLGLDASGMAKGAADYKKAMADIKSGTDKAGRAADDTSKRTRKGMKDENDLRQKYHNEQTRQFKEQLEQSRKLASGLNNIKGELVALLATFTAGKGAADFLSNVIQTNAALAAGSKLLGAHAQDVQNWKNVVRANQGDPNSVVGIMRSLENIGTQFKTQTIDKDTLQLLLTAGVNPAHLLQPTQALPELAKGAEVLESKGMSPEMVRSLYATRLGITDPGMLLALTQGSKQLKDMLATMQKMDPISDKEADQALQAAIAWSILGNQLQRVGTQISTMLMPVILQVTQWLSDFAAWAQVHPRLATAAFVAITTAIVALGAALVGINILGAIGSAMAAMEALPALAAAFAAFGEVLLPIVLIGAALAAIYFLVQDFVSYMRTGKSAIDWGFAVPIFEKIQAGINHVWEQAKKLFDLIPPSAWQAIGQAITQFILSPFKMLADTLSFISDILDAIIDGFVNHDWSKAAGDMAKAAVDFGKFMAHSVGMTVPGDQVGDQGQGRGSTAPAPAGRGQRAGAGGGGGGGDGWGRALSYVLGWEGVMGTDQGGLTHWGISTKAYPTLDIANLTKEQAIGIYKRDFWNGVGIGSLPPNMQLEAFDAAVNNGINWTKNALQEAGNDPAKFEALREARYRHLATLSAKNAADLPGWLNRARGAYDRSIMSGASANPAIASRTSNTSVTATTNINGPININTHSGDPAAIAAGLRGAVARNSYVPQLATALV